MKILEDFINYCFNEHTTSHSQKVLTILTLIVPVVLWFILSIPLFIFFIFDGYWKTKQRDRLYVSINESKTFLFEDTHGKYTLTAQEVSDMANECIRKREFKQNLDNSLK